MLDLINEFTHVRSKSDKIKIKLKGFKKQYNITEEEDENNHVFFKNTIDKF